jgi:hypothetical protein
MNALVILSLIIGGVTIPNEQLTQADWQGGTVVYSHNWQGGQYFYDMQGAVISFADNTSAEYIVTKSMVYTPLETWVGFLPQYSRPGDVTLVTCYPKTGRTSWRMVVQLTPVSPRFVPMTSLPSAVPDPATYCRAGFWSWRLGIF